MTSSELANNAVTSGKIQNGSVTGADIKNGTIASSELANNAVTNSKIANGAVTKAKIAPGTIPEMRITITNALQNDQMVPAPSGVNRAECIFFAFMKYLNIPKDQDILINCYCDEKGKVIATPADRVAATGVAIWKKGGWT